MYPSPPGEEEERCEAQPEMCQTGVFFSVKAVVLTRIHRPLIFADISQMFVDVGVLQMRQQRIDQSQFFMSVSYKPLPPPKRGNPTWVNHMFGGN